MRKNRLFTLAAVGALFTGTGLSAQQPKEVVPTAAATALPSPARAITASLEERIAAAQSVKVMGSILGIELGSDLDEAHEKLDPLCAPGTHPKAEGGEEEEKARDADEKKTPGTALSGGASESKTKPGADEDEGRKVLWQLAGTDYSAIYITADDKEHILSITGILRPGKEMPFDKVGEVSKAPVQNDRSIVWDVLRPNRPLFRVLAKGADGKASTVMLFVVRPKAVVGVPQSEKRGGGKVD